MSEQELRTWILKYDLSNTEAAAALGIAYPTLVTFLRGTRPSEDSINRMRTRMRDYEMSHKPKPAA